MFGRTIEIIGTSFIMAMQELWKNKLRTFLSLFGVTIGIFCIIGVLATVGSLEQNIKNEIKALGNNSIIIDKWEWQSGNDFWWKYVNRPSPKYKEVKEIRERTPAARYVAFSMSLQDNVEYGGSVLSNVKYYGVSEDFDNIQPMEIGYGRYPLEGEFAAGRNVLVIGYEIAEQLFGEPELAVDKEITIRGKKAVIVGVLKKQGQQMIDAWAFDKSVIIPYRFARTFMNELKADPVIMVQGLENYSTDALKNDLTGAMRAIHKLSPVKEDDFSLNDINELSESFNALFIGLSIAGAVIGGISLIVGLFGVANIMFVSVRERTSQIGLKKALGAKSRVILSEFLLESAFLCLIGGVIGLTLVFLLTLILSGALSFPVYISTSNVIWTFVICVLVGVIAGIVPAFKASRMDPVVAIRSK
jgi:putative ABC transport system permease protein